MKIPRIETRLQLPAPADVVWDVITDTRQWPRWGPSLRAVASSDRHIRLGSRGRVLTVVGAWVPFTVTHFKDGRYWSWSVAGIPATGHEIEPMGRNRCRLAFQVPFSAAPYIVVCRLALHRIAAIL